jgi:uridine kinase
MTILILRHVSGAGSSTLAQSLVSTCQDAIVCCADDYMMENGKYVFHPNKLGAAHSACQNKFIQACEEKKRLIIVSNTATKVRDFEFYEQNGRKY